MTIQQRKKQLIIRTGIAGISLLVGITIGIVACGSDAPANTKNGSQMESQSASMQDTASTPSTENTESELTMENEAAEELDEAVLKYIEVEAGTEALATEDYFSEYSGQNFSVSTPLTAEQLCAVGSSFEVPVVCDGVNGIVTVKVIDTTAPVIEGAKDRTVYLNASVSYKKNITVTDNSGEEIDLQVDASAVDTSTVGSYAVKYSATDTSGNVATAEITLKVIEKPVINEEYVRPMVEEIVNQVVTDDMSQWDKAWALYLWCHKNIKYGSAGDRTSIWTGAYEGVHNRSGDCYVYYATYAAMLDIVGIPNMQVARVGGTSHHWWNLVNVGDGWYHCDASPRRASDANYYCFMQTDAQVAAYTESYPEKPNYYTFDSSLYPERGTVTVYDGGKHGNKMDTAE